MNYDQRLKQMLKNDPLRGAAASRRDVLKGIGAGAGALALGAAGGFGSKSAQAASRELRMLTWDGYVDSRVLDGFTEQYGSDIKYELHTSDPDSVNKLRAGQTEIWDIINLNNPWARQIMWPEDLIVELAQRGAARVIGLDIQPERLEAARRAAEAAGVADHCLFAETTEERADLITSLDAFEHFDDPAAMLDLMAKLLKPDGAVIASFGPTWYHPLGGHLFSIFPWAHLLFSEKALMRWRNDLRDDGATCFREVAGGLNQMTIRRFERIVGDGPFRIERLQTVPIRKLRSLHNRLTRELTTAIVRCRLILIE